MAKTRDVSYIRADGVKVTVCAPRAPRKSERTWTVDKSKHSVWTQGHIGYVRGTHGTFGTTK